MSDNYSTQKVAHPAFPHGQNAKPVQFGMVHLSCARAGSFESAKPHSTSARDYRAIVQHVDVSCDRCGQRPVVGVRYRCSMCANYDLCESCLIRLEDHSSPTILPPFHDPSHLFLRIPKPSNTSFYPTVVNRSETVHKGITCDGCFTNDIRGYRYICQTCKTLNFCEACEAKGVHPVNHPRTKLATPDTTETYSPF
jgi:hypothetical protein